MAKLSIIIPSYKDKDLQRTIDDLNNKAIGDVQIIAVLDGYNEEVKGAETLQTPRVGMREVINRGVEISSGDYIMKCDAHCIFDEGFDVKLLEDIEDDWVVIPRRFFLDTDKWEIMTDENPVDYERLVIDKPDKIGGVKWRTRARQRKDILIDETPVFQGSCWIMSRKHWNRIGGLPEEGYGSFTQEPIQIALKTWLGGGKVMVNKKTWYAHKHRKFGRNTHINSKEVRRGNKYSQDYWLNNRWRDRKYDLDWLMKKFEL